MYLKEEDDNPDHLNKPVTHSLLLFLRSAAIWKQLIKVMTYSSSLQIT